METFTIDELPEKSPIETIEEFIEAIPDGQAVKLRDALRETGLTNRNGWMEIAGARCIVRYLDSRKVYFLVNKKTAKKLSRDPG